MMAASLSNQKMLEVADGSAERAQPAYTSIDCFLFWDLLTEKPVFQRPLRGIDELYTVI